MDPSVNYKAYLEAVDGDMDVESFKKDKKFEAFVLAYKCRSTNNTFFNDWTVERLEKEAMSEALKEEIMKQPLAVRIFLLRNGRNLKTYKKTIEHLVEIVSGWNLGEAAGGLVVSIFIGKIPHDYKLRCPSTLDINEWKNFAVVLDQSSSGVVGTNISGIAGTISSGIVETNGPDKAAKNDANPGLVSGTSLDITPSTTPGNTPSLTPTSTPRTSLCSTAKNGLQIYHDLSYDGSLADSEDTAPSLFDTPPTPGKTFVMGKLSIRTISGFQEAESISIEDTYAIATLKNNDFNIVTVVHHCNSKLSLWEIKTRKKKKVGFYCDVLEIFTKMIADNKEAYLILKDIHLVNTFKKLSINDENVKKDNNPKVTNAKNNISKVNKINIYYMPCEISCKLMLICTEALRKFSTEASKRKIGEVKLDLNIDILKDIAVLQNNR